MNAQMYNVQKITVESDESSDFVFLRLRIDGLSDTANFTIGASDKEMMEKLKKASRTLEEIFND